MTDMTHEYARRALHLGAAELSPVENANLAEHLEGCPTCRSYAARLETLRPELSGVLHTRWDARYPSVELPRRIAQRARRDTVKRQILSLASGVVSIIALLAVLFMFRVVIPRPAAHPTATPNPPTSSFTPLPSVLEVSSTPVSSPTAKPSPQPTSTSTPELSQMRQSFWTVTSPGGQWIAWGGAAFPLASESGGDYYSALKVSRTDGSVVWTILDEWKPQNWDYTIPAFVKWSNDGQFLYFTIRPGPEGCNTFHNNGMMKRFYLLTGQVQDFSGGDWVAISPNEWYLAYPGYKDGTGVSLFNLPANPEYGGATEGVVSLDIDTATVYGILWAPDSSQLVLTLGYDACTVFHTEPLSTAILQVDVDTYTSTILIPADERLLTSLYWPMPDRVLVRDKDQNVWWMDPGSGALMPLTIVEETNQTLTVMDQQSLTWVIDKITGQVVNPPVSVPANPTGLCTLTTPIAKAPMIWDENVSPDGQWVAYFTASKEVLANTMVGWPIGTLNFTNLQTGEACSHPEYTTEISQPTLDWSTDGPVNLITSQGTFTGLPCQTEPFTQTSQQTTADLIVDPPNLASRYSPDGKYQIKTEGLASEIDMLKFETSILAIDTGKVVQQVTWYIDPRVGSYENYTGGEWVSRSQFLIYETIDRGPLILDADRGAIQVLTDLLGIQDIPTPLNGDLFSLVATPLPGIEPDQYHLLVSGIFSEADFPNVSLYHSESGVVESLPYRYLWYGGFSPDHQWILMDKRPDVSGYEAHEIWIRKLEDINGEWQLLAGPNIVEYNALWNTSYTEIVLNHEDRITWQNFPNPEEKPLTCWLTSGYWTNPVAFSADGCFVVATGNKPGGSEYGLFILDRCQPQPTPLAAP